MPASVLDRRPACLIPSFRSFRIALFTFVCVAFATGCGPVSETQVDESTFTGQDATEQPPPAWLILEVGSIVAPLSARDSRDPITICPSANDLRDNADGKASKCRSGNAKMDAYRVTDIEQFNENHYAVRLRSLGWIGADDLSPKPAVGSIATVEKDEHDVYLAPGPDDDVDDNVDPLADDTKVEILRDFVGHTNDLQVQVVDGVLQGKRGFITSDSLETSEDYDADIFVSIRPTHSL